jgi:hypothetical protein
MENQDAVIQFTLKEHLAALTSKTEPGKSLTYFFSLFLCAVLLNLAPLPEAVAATKEWTGCPVKSFYDVDPGQKLSVSWSVTGESRVVSFQADKILLGGGKAMMSASQLAQWTPYLDELRNAASQKIKVQIFYDDTTHVVLAINVIYNQGC